MKGALKKCISKYIQVPTVAVSELLRIVFSLKQTDILQFFSLKLTLVMHCAKNSCTCMCVCLQSARAVLLFATVCSRCIMCVVCNSVHALPHAGWPSYSLSLSATQMFLIELNKLSFTSL